MNVEFRVLGGLQLMVDGVDRSPSAPKVRQVLALLLANANHVVQAESIMAEIWADSRPASATTTTQTYVYQLRKLLTEHGICGCHEEALTTRGTGYVLEVEPQCVDEHNFRELVQRGQHAVHEGRHKEAAGFMRQALHIWEGAPFGDVDQGLMLEAHALNLTELHERAVEVRVEAEMNMGHHRELIADLRLLVAQQPLNEWLHDRLVEALGRAGRRSEALDAYQSMRRLLDDELGLNPSAASQQIQAELLNA